MEITLDRIKASLGISPQVDAYDQMLQALLPVAREVVKADTGVEVPEGDIASGLLYQLTMVTITDLFLQRSSTSTQQQHYSDVRNMLLESFLSQQAQARLANP